MGRRKCRGCVMATAKDYIKKLASDFAKMRRAVEGQESSADGADGKAKKPLTEQQRAMLSEALDSIVDGFLQSPDGDAFEKAFRAELFALPPEIKQALGGKKDARRTLIRALLVKGYAKDEVTAKDALSQALSMDVKKARVEESKGPSSEGAKKQKHPAAAVISRVKKTVQQLQGQPYPLLEAWLSAQSPIAGNLAPYKSPNTFPAPYTTWMELGSIGDVNLRNQGAKKALEEAAVQTVSVRSVDKTTEDGQSFLQLAASESEDKETIEIDPQAFTKMLSDAGGFKKVQAQVWATFWENLPPVVISAYLKTPRVLPSDAWIALGARIKGVVPKTVSFGKPASDAEMNQLFDALRNALQKGTSGEKNAKKAILPSEQTFGLPEQLIGVFEKGGTIKDFTEPTASDQRSWTTAFRDGGVEFEPQVGVPQTFFEQANIPAKERAVDDRGAWVDLALELLETTRTKNPNGKAKITKLKPLVEKKPKATKKAHKEKDVDVDDDDLLLAERLLSEGGATAALLLDALSMEDDATDEEIEQLIAALRLG